MHRVRPFACGVSRQEQRIHTKRLTYHCLLCDGARMFLIDDIVGIATFKDVDSLLGGSPPSQRTSDRDRPPPCRHVFYVLPNLVFKFIWLCLSGWLSLALRTHTGRRKRLQRRPFGQILQADSFIRSVYLVKHWSSEASRVAFFWFFGFCNFVRLS